MNAKQWLSRARNIDREIDEKLKEKQAIRDKLMRTTPTYSGDIVQSPVDPHKFDRIVELEEYIDRRIDELLEVKKEIFCSIDKLQDGRYREVLALRYCHEVKLKDGTIKTGMTFEQIAVHMNYSYKQVCRIHGRALLKMEEVLHGNISY